MKRQKISLPSPFGSLVAEVDERRLLKVTWGAEVVPAVEEIFDLSLMVIEEFSDYWQGKRRIFSIPCDFSGGSLFQQRVWRALTEIPYGETVSYAEVVEMAGLKPLSHRAVGAACARNPLAVIVPCHRVIKKDGSLGSYSAPGGADLKRSLLKFEKSVKLNGRP